MNKTLLALGSLLAVSLLVVSSPVFADDGTDTEDYELDGDDFGGDAFDEMDFEEVSFEDAAHAYRWHDQVKLELSHQLGISKNSDWNATTNSSQLLAGWSGTPFPLVFVELEGQFNYYWGDDTRVGSGDDGEDYDTAINAAYAQTSLGDFSVKAGYYTVGWGEVEGAGVLDIINPTASIASGSMDITGRAQPFVGVDWFVGNATINGFVNLKPEVAFLDDVDDLELGSSVKISLQGSDVTLYGARLLQNTAAFDLISSALVAEPYQLMGASVNRGFGKILLKADVAYKSGLSMSDASLAGIAEINRLDYAVGLEIGFNAGGQLVVMVSNQQILDFATSYQVAPGFAAKENSAQLMANYSDSFLNEDLSWNLGTMASLDGEMAAVFTDVSYTLNDNWKLSAQGLTALADEASLFGSFNEEVQISAGVRWQK